MKWDITLEHAEFVDTKSAASVVVGHAGMGSVITAMQHNVAFVMLQRLLKARENITNHHMATARWLEDKPEVLIAKDDDVLAREISAAEGWSGSSGSVETIATKKPTDPTESLTEEFGRAMIQSQLARSPKAPVHVFFVQSNITLICAISIILAEGLADCDVRLVYVRGARQNTPWESHDFPMPEGIDIPSRFFGFALEHILNARSRLNNLDAFLGEVTDGRAAHYYLYKTRRDFFHLIITHPNSTGFSIMEEGNTSYRLPTAYTPNLPEVSGVKRKTKLLLKRVAIALLYGRRAMGRGEFEETYTTVAKGARRYYCFSDQAFRNTPRRKILDFRQGCLASEGPLKAPELPDGTVVLALDNIAHISESNLTEYKNWISAQVKAIDTESDRLVLLAYKHHPQPSPRRTEMDAFFEEVCSRHPGIIVARLGLDVSLELLAAKNTGLVFLTKTSSVGRYAALLGAKVTSEYAFG